MKLSIIIISYNTSSLTKKCLDSLTQTLIIQNFTDCEIIIVDNYSSDNSVGMLQTYKSKSKKIPIITIFNSHNVGYGKANNIGAKVAKGDSILLLNSDTIIKNINFLNLLSFFNKNKNIGGLTVRVEFLNGAIDPASHRGFPTIWNSLCYFLKFEKIAQYIPFLKKYFGGYHLINLDFNTIHEIDSPSGAFFLIKKYVWNKTHGFDPEYFMYGEDLDLSYKIKQLGYKILYYPKYSIIHLKHQSGLKTKNTSIQKVTKKHFYISMKIFYRKHYAQNHLTIINKIIYFLIDLKTYL